MLPLVQGLDVHEPQRADNKQAPAKVVPPNRVLLTEGEGLQTAVSSANAWADHRAD
jgi:hypothetical protein